MDESAHARIEHILSFWFGPLSPQGVPFEDRAQLWFGANPKTDKEIRARFAADLQAAVDGRLVDWQQSARGRLALILLCDQFTRHIHRHAARAFAHDPLARSLCVSGIERGHDRELRPIERLFFCMPLQHSEELALQDRCVQHYQALLADLPPPARVRLKPFLDHAIGHREIIKRFGRFPYRNCLLGRPSTAAELQYLATRKAGFCQG